MHKLTAAYVSPQPLRCNYWNPGPSVASLLENLCQIRQDLVQLGGISAPVCTVMGSSLYTSAVSARGSSHNAYSKAVGLLQKKYATDGERQSFLRSVYSIEDVLETVAEAQSKYAQKAEGFKARKWLGGLSTRIMYYGQIVDVMSQHHPEYVSLAWGTLKFLFVVSISRFLGVS